MYNVNLRRVCSAIVLVQEVLHVSMSVALGI